MKTGWPRLRCLRDTGKFINHQGHHRHTQYIISSSEMYRIYADAAHDRLGDRALPGQEPSQPGDRALRNIPPEEHKHVHSAIVLLRLAEALNQDRASDVLRVARKGLSQAGLSGDQAGAYGCGTGAVVAA